MIIKTKCLEGKPVLVFVEQMDWDIGRFGDLAQGIRKLGNLGENFIFKDSDWQDLAIQVSGIRKKDKD